MRVGPWGRPAPGRDIAMWHAMPRPRRATTPATPQALLLHGIIKVRVRSLKSKKRDCLSFGGMESTSMSGAVGQPKPSFASSPCPLVACRYARMEQLLMGFLLTAQQKGMKRTILESDPTLSSGIRKENGKPCHSTTFVSLIEKFSQPSPMVHPRTLLLGPGARVHWFCSDRAKLRPQS